MQKVKARRRWKPLKKKTRITVDISPEKHKRIKAIASLKGETLQEFVLGCVDEKMSQGSTKSKLETLDQLGLVGSIEESKISSTNYKKHLIKSVKKKHDVHNH